jgi:catechol 2,3-dioxygenase-like lactoylglutathione lyase family enzyme
MISAVTLMVKDMERSCRFYSRIPGFRLVYGGGSSDQSFTTYRVGDAHPPTYLNLELREGTTTTISSNQSNDLDRRHFGRIIFHTNDVDKLYSLFKDNREISEALSFENEPRDAPWGERYFHIREPDGYQLSFAEPSSPIQ